MSFPIHIAAAQYSTEVDNRAVCRDRAIHLMDQAAHTSDLVVLPEHSFAGCCANSDVQRYAEPVPGPTSTVAEQIAVDRNAYICYCTIERDGDKYYNTAVLISSDGHLVGRYRKIALTHDEIDAGLSAGSHVEAFHTHLGTIGILSREDIHDHENLHALHVAGAQLLIVPCLISADSLESIELVADSWQKELTMVAKRDQFHVLSANKIGVECDHPMIGHSMVIDPDGNIVAMGSENIEEIVRTKITLQPRGIHG